MPFSSKLRELRKQRKWSQNELGRRIGVHGRHIGKYENGQVMPNAETVIKIADVFGVSTDYLLLDKENVDPYNIKDSELLKFFQELDGMEPKDKDTVKSLIDAYLKKNKLEAIIAG